MPSPAATLAADSPIAETASAGAAGEAPMDAIGGAIARLSASAVSTAP